MKTERVNVYDFDYTIYRGDASIDFIVYCWLHNPRLWKYIPTSALGGLRYIFGLLDRQRIKEIAFSFLRDIPDIDAEVERFWRLRARKIRQWYRDSHRDSDVIITASPEFLIAPIAKKLGVRAALATRMDKRSGKIMGQNNRGNEKLRRLRAHDENLTIDHFYSDSLSDAPLLKLATHPYVVRKGVAVPLADYHPSRLDTFKTPAFIRFLLVGCVNAFLGVMFAYVCSFFISSPLLAWAVGYAASLIPSYLLNAVITFRHFAFSLRQFGSFCISYAPNFLVQLICVHVLVNYFGLYRLIAYILAVAIGVPVTFLLLATFTFNSKGSK